MPALHHAVAGQDILGHLDRVFLDHARLAARRDLMDRGAGDAAHRQHLLGGEGGAGSFQPSLDIVKFFSNSRHCHFSLVDDYSQASTSSPSSAAVRGSGRTDARPPGLEMGEKAQFALFRRRPAARAHSRRKRHLAGAAGALAAAHRQQRQPRPLQRHHQAFAYRLRPRGPGPLPTRSPRHAAPEERRPATARRTPAGQRYSASSTDYSPPPPSPVKRSCASCRSSRIDSRGGGLAAVEGQDPDDADGQIGEDRDRGSTSPARAARDRPSRPPEWPAAPARRRSRPCRRGLELAQRLQIDRRRNRDQAHKAPGSRRRRRCRHS